MRKLSGALLVACAMWQLGCEPPMKSTGTLPIKPAPGGQSGSTTGGGAEVPTPATMPAETPKTETPVLPTETTPEAKPVEEKKPEEAAPEKKAE